MNEQTEFTKEQLEQALQVCLKSFDVPEMRKKDFRWLQRNLAIRNIDNPAFSFAMGLIVKILKMK